MLGSVSVATAAPVIQSKVRVAVDQEQRDFTARGSVSRGRSDLAAPAPVTAGTEPRVTLSQGAAIAYWGGSDSTASSVCNYFAEFAPYSLFVEPDSTILCA